MAESSAKKKQPEKVERLLMKYMIPNGHISIPLTSSGIQLPQGKRFPVS
jgi:hypothetical protein